MPDTHVCDSKRKICSDASAVMEKITSVQSMLRLISCHLYIGNPLKHVKKILSFTYRYYQEFIYIIQSDLTIYKNYIHPTHCAKKRDNKHVCIITFPSDLAAKLSKSKR